ncbi:hypothetical protein SESBI_30771 [Sesbania bispinosa]|nr:hypothetical protein SESBI_30771 [Sesbania bispinosa]
MRKGTAVFWYLKKTLPAKTILRNSRTLFFLSLPGPLPFFLPRTSLRAAVPVSDLSPFTSSAAAPISPSFVRVVRCWEQISVRVVRHSAVSAAAPVPVPTIRGQSMTMLAIALAIHELFMKG